MPSVDDSSVPSRWSPGASDIANEPRHAIEQCISERPRRQENPRTIKRGDCHDDQVFRSEDFEIEIKQE
jgi:hypothetical protein